MSDYINREDAEKYFRDFLFINKYADFKTANIKELTNELCKRIPSADVVERKRGKWIHLDGDEWCCSCCGRVINTEGSWEQPLSEEQQRWFCEGCGADMRERKDNENI